MSTGRGTPDQTIEPIPQDYPSIGKYVDAVWIGCGAHADVYRARDTALDRTVAIKLLRGIEPQYRDRFLVEAKLTAALDHPNIVRTFDYGDHAGRPFFAMPYLAGGTVAALIDALRRFPDAENPGGARLRELLDAGGARLHRDVREALQGTKPWFRLVAAWMAMAADALEFAHEHEIFHADVKPGNLLLAPDGRLMLADFGIGCVDHDGELFAGRIVYGTPRYLSPERSVGGPPDVASDIWALGATMYEMLTLRPLYGGATDADVFRQIATEDAEHPRSRSPLVPARLGAICLKALRRRPAKRVTSAREFAELLRKWLRGK